MAADAMMKIIYQGGQGELVEKKSRFIATVRPVTSEEEAVAFVAEMKKKYWDAKHNCSAFVLGSRQEITRCSDDGEPAGTAGRPMLDVLLRQGITNVAVVVTRYFGGVLLGTGGLVRAYQGAVAEGLSQCQILQQQEGYRLMISTDYNGYGKVKYFIEQNQLPVDDNVFAEDVKIYVMIPRELKEDVGKAIINETSGVATLDWGDLITYALMDGKLMNLE